LRQPSWRPTLGCRIEGGGARFRVWAPQRRSVDVVIVGGGGDDPHPLVRQDDGSFAGLVDGLGPGTCYRYRLDGGDLVAPDPASRFQPEGVHGPSEAIDPSTFPWSDSEWGGLSLEDLVIYELHVGTFTEEGTFRGVEARLPHLRDLGITALELMPVADFPGRRNWGYDGVAPFAPARCYGRPDDLRRLVDAAHRLGLAVLLDVVYNHFGPDGAYQGLFSPQYFTPRHATPWGDAINLDSEGCAMVRDYFVENACHWLHEYRFDGLRLDATHALKDYGPRHFLAELTSRVRATLPERGVLLIAEDHRNLALMVRPEAEGGWGLDAVWADDLHHEIRRGLAGDSDGYFRDFSGSTADIATTIRRGWFFVGQPSQHLGGPRGTDPGGLDPCRFVVCLQNHDQVGNRALGERLNQALDAATYRATSSLLLLVPEMPLLFMGQEWSADSPFLYFTDHEPGLGKLVTEGRRREFGGFAAFSEPGAAERIPDPQASATFEASRLDWAEVAREPHASVLRLYRALIALRRREAPFFRGVWDGFDAQALGEDALCLRRVDGRDALIVAVQLRGSGGHSLGPGAGDDPRRWSLLLSTEDPAYAPDPAPPALDLATITLRFSRPGAVVLKGVTGDPRPQR
jgi:maltooligosyltrehalose trehalohydrolase